MANRDMSDTTALWHPFADMGSHAPPLVLDRAEGSWVFDEAGNRYLDGSASLWYANAGHGRSELVSAVTKQLERLDAYSIFGDYANRPAMDLADALSTLAPTPGSKVFLTVGGGEAIDTAAKLARAYWRVMGEPQKHHVISRTSAYHGTQGFGTSIGGMPAVTSGFGPLIEETSTVPFDSVEALEARITSLEGRAAAFFCEPVIGAGGVLHPPPGYIEAAAALCAKHRVLFVCDSVICGFGRLGTWFGIERFGVEPDMITFAKGVSSGILPIGGVIISGRVAEPFWDGPGGPVFAHGATYAGHPACCAAALATLAVYEREQLIPRGRELEGVLARVLEPLTGDPRVGDVRAGLGLMAAVELSEDFIASLKPGVAAGRRFQLALRECGVLVRAIDRGVAISPPLSIDESELETLGAAVGDALDALAATAARAVGP